MSLLRRTLVRTTASIHYTPSITRGTVHRAAAFSAASSSSSSSAIQFPHRSFHTTTSRHAFSYPSSRTLDEIVRLPMLIPHTRSEIVDIWTAHHAQSNNAATASDTMTTKEFEQFAKNASAAPLFVVPAFKMIESPAANGATTITFDPSSFEMMLINLQQTSLLLTSLEEYRTKGASDAIPYAVVTLYTDMSSSKDLVLVRAEMMDVNVSLMQLRQLWYLIKQFYIEDADAFTKFPRGFNTKPNPSFDFDAYIRVCKEKIAQIKYERPAPQNDTQAAEFVTSEETATKQ